LKIKSHRDFAAGLLFVAAGIGFAVGASHRRVGEAADPGPGYLPLVLGIVLAVMGGLVLFKSLAIEAEGSDPIGPIGWRVCGITLVSVLLFALLLPVLGLVVCAPLLVVLSAWAAGPLRWKRALFAALIFTLLAGAVFIGWLQLSVPWWPTWRF